MSKKYLYTLFVFYCFISQINAKYFGLEKASFITLIIIIIIIFIIIIFFIILLIRVNIMNQRYFEKKDMIKKKKVYIFQKIIIPLNKIPNDALNYGTQCPICLDDFTPLKKVCATPCKHIFHFKCLRKYIIETNNSKCPLCNFDLLSILEGKKINYKKIIIPEKELSLDLVEQEDDNFDNTNSPFNQDKNQIILNQKNIDNNNQENNVNINNHQKIKKMLSIDEQLSSNDGSTAKYFQKKQNSLIIYNRNKENQIIMINNVMKNYTEVDNN